MDQVLSWLNRQTSKPPYPIYSNTLGIGWAIADEEAEYPVPHLLPRASDWPILPPAYMPILVNWLLTGKCPLKCVYCYAQDVMQGNYLEPDGELIKRIAENILKVDPLVVVLTGGDPLTSPHLEEAIKLLHHKVGIIVDTSAYSLTSKHISMFKKYEVFVRISLDSEIPRINNDLRRVLRRPQSNGEQPITSAEAALNAIIACVDNGIKVAVQTVATRKNRSDFEALGNTLCKLGVSGWRILMVAPSANNRQIYHRLSGDETSQKRFFGHIVEQLMLRQENLWHYCMSVQVSSSQFPNAVILVAPDGTFLTESNLERQDSGKIIIDDDYPKTPRLENIRNHVDMFAHTARYLNSESRAFLVGRKK
ncbi:radical SAM protein [Chloroflexota bacterium]